MLPHDWAVKLDESMWDLLFEKIKHFIHGLEGLYVANMILILPFLSHADLKTLSSREFSVP